MRRLDGRWRPVCGRVPLWADPGRSAGGLRACGGRGGRRGRAGTRRGRNSAAPACVPLLVSVEMHPEQLAGECLSQVDGATVPSDLWRWAVAKIAEVDTNGSARTLIRPMHSTGDANC